MQWHKPWIGIEPYSLSISALISMIQMQMQTIQAFVDLTHNIAMVEDQNRNVTTKT